MSTAPPIPTDRLELADLPVVTLAVLHANRLSPVKAATELILALGLAGSWLFLAGLAIRLVAMPTRHVDVRPSLVFAHPLVWLVAVGALAIGWGSACEAAIDGNRDTLRQLGTRMVVSIPAAALVLLPLPDVYCIRELALAVPAGWLCVVAAAGFLVHVRHHALVPHLLVVDKSLTLHAAHLRSRELGRGRAGLFLVVGVAPLVLFAAGITAFVVSKAPSPGSALVGGRLIAGGSVLIGVVCCAGAPLGSVLLQAAAYRIALSQMPSTASGTPRTSSQTTSA